MAYYKTHLFCCLNERPAGHPRGCCKEKGAERLRNYMKARVKELGLTETMRVNNAGCLDRCELGPVVVIYGENDPAGTWYTWQSLEDAEEIIQSHLLKGEPVKRLMLTDDQKLELRPEQKQGACS